MAKVLEVIWGVRKQKYFCKWGWTPLPTNRPTGKSPEPVLLSALPVFASTEARETPIEIQWIGWVEPLRNPSQKLQLMGIAEFIIGLIRATRWFRPSCAPA
jgi:hypothetical protein